MTTIGTVLRCYGDAWRLGGLFVGVHLVVRLLAYAVITPLLGALVTLAVSLSDQSALTDQDIAAFIATPAGFVATIGLLGLFLVAEVLGFAVMSAIIRGGGDDGWKSLSGALALVARRARVLVEFAVRFVLRVLALSVLPLAAAGLVALYFLGEYDIKHYLSTRPPELIRAAALIVPILLGLAALLLNRLSAWAMALHLVLFSDVTPRAAFGRSAAMMAGRRFRLQRELLIWLAVRMALAVLLAALAGAVANLIPVSGLPLVLVGMALVLGAWALAGLVLSALSLGALAFLVNRHFDAAAGGTGVLAATAIGDLAGLEGDFVALNKGMATPRRLRAIHGAGKDVYVWTINDPLEMSTMISRGVDGLITDEPALAGQVLSYRARLSTPERLLLRLAEILGLELNRKEYRDRSP